MARQPKQVHTYLYRMRDGQYEYAIFQRADLPVCWQGVIGGGEDGETLEVSARRELFEEAGVTENLPLHKLECLSYVPARSIGEYWQKIWGQAVVVVPIHYFAMPYDKEIVLSAEHLAVKWLPFEEAHELVYYRDQKVALYELHEKLLRGLIV